MPTQRYKTNSTFETDLVTISLAGNFLLTLKPFRYRYGPNPGDYHEVQQYKLTDGASDRGAAILIGIEKSDLNKLGVLHDDCRDSLYCSNQLADSYLYDAALALRKNYWQSIILYYAVRIGTFLKYKTKIDIHVIKNAKYALAKHLGIDASKITFNPNTNTFIV